MWVFSSLVWLGGAGWGLFWRWVGFLWHVWDCSGFVWLGQADERLLVGGVSIVLSREVLVVIVVRD